jgi:hypothetical protein
VKLFASAFAIAFALLLPTAGGQADDRQFSPSPSTPAASIVFPRIFYVDHGTTLRSAKYVGYSIPAAITRRVTSVAKGNGNVAWITNLPDDPTVITQYVREFRSRGIEVVAGSGHWYVGAWNYDRPGVADEQFATIQRLRSTLPADAQPWKWSLADEPPPEALPTLRQLADKCRAAGVPTIAVQVPEYHAATVDRLGSSIPSLACDVYPFFVPGLPSNPPYGPAALIRAKEHYAATVTRSRTAGISPLMMVQGFADESLFAMPSPARVRWQLWAAVAAGHQGVVTFAHGVPWELPGGQAASLVDLRTETHTVQGEAVAAVYGRLKLVEGRIAGTTAESPPAWGAAALPGDCVASLRTVVGRRVLIVVSDPDAAVARSLKVTLPGVSGMTPLAGSTGATLQALRWPWSMFVPATLQVSLQPGDAWIGELR